MKIAVISSMVIPCPPPGYSGLEMIAYQVASGLAELGHDVTLVAPEGSRCDNCTLVMPSPPGNWDEKSAYRKYWEILPGFDAVVDMSWQHWPYMLKQEGKLKAPVLGVLHSLVEGCLKQLPAGVENPCFVCISHDQASVFHALFGRPARVAWNGVDVDFYKDMEVGRTNRLGRTNRFLFLGRFSSIKGADLAIDASKEAGVGLDLIGDTKITGEPDYFKMCEEKARLGWLNEKFPGHDTSIKIHGAASRGECVWWFSQAHAMIHPVQRFREPFGLAPVEAQLCGVPVIAWDNGAMRETVKHGVSGLLVKSQRELVDAINSHWMQAITQADRDGCREWASQFSVQRMVKRYEELCTQAVEGDQW